MNGTSTRAGRYVQQPNGYRAFIPDPLPPDPPVDITPEMQALLSRADRELGRLDGSIQTLHEITGQTRNRKFMYRNYIDLFRDNAEEVRA